jgi:lysine-specific demethylase/histidyl-hydroxylase NO66
MQVDIASGGDGTGAVAEAATARGHSFPSGDALQRCIGVSTGYFAEHHWGRAPLLTPAAAENGFDDLFSPAAVDELISSRGLRTPFLRMAKEGAVLPERSFTRAGGSGATIADQAADDRILAQLADGATLVLQALHRIWPPLVHFGSALAEQLGHPVQINSYVTPAQNQGFSAHYDTHDVFVLQIAGTKRWVISAPVLEHPLPDQTWDRRKQAVAARAAEPPLLDTVLRPGDALYLPRGFLHSATAQGELSIHLTVGVHPVTGYRLAEMLLQLLKDDPEVRRSLPMSVDLADAQVLAEHLHLVADRLAAAAQQPDKVVDRAAGVLGADLRSATRPAPLEPLAQLAFAAELQPDARLQRRPGLRFMVSGDGRSITALDKTVTLPPSLADAATVLLDGDVHTPAELAGLEESEQLVLARRLLREGLLVPAPHGRAWGG